MDDAVAKDEHMPDYRGKTVKIEEMGCGEIIDQTELCVGILLGGEGYRVFYVPIKDLQPHEDDGTHAPEGTVADTHP
jgi:hypothetical protein